MSNQGILVFVCVAVLYFLAEVTLLTIPWKKVLPRWCRRALFTLILVAALIYAVRGIS